MNEAHGYLQIKPKEFEIPDNVTFLPCGGRREVFRTDTPTVKSGSCRGPSGVPGGATASPTPRGPVFPARSATPVPEPTATPPPVETPVATEAPTPEPTRPTVADYTTREGDTVTAVAGFFGVDPEELAKANGITVDTPLTPGTVLVIPGG